MTRSAVPRARSIPYRLHEMASRRPPHLTNMASGVAGGVLHFVRGKTEVSTSEEA